MNFVLINSESHYPVRKRRMRATVLGFLAAHNLAEVEISVAVVGSRKIRQLNRQWRQLDEPTPVLSFALKEPRGPDGLFRLGEIVISYPQARAIAQQDNLLVDQVIDRLLIHGLQNLLNG